MKKDILRIICLICCLLLVIKPAVATVSCNFNYASEIFEAVFRINAGSEDNQHDLIYQEVKKGLPYILGIEKAINNQTPKFTIFLDCQSGIKSFLQIGEKPKKEFSCNQFTLSEIIIQMGNELNVNNIKPIYKIAGYTLQIAYVQKSVSLEREVNKWNKIFENYKNTSNFDIECDPYILPIYTHTNKNGTHVIRFGLFRNYIDAKKTIDELKLNRKRTKIIHVNMKIEDMKDFFHITK